MLLPLELPSLLLPLELPSLLLAFGAAFFATALGAAFSETSLVAAFLGAERLTLVMRIFSHHLAMASLLGVALAALLLEDDDFVALNMGFQLQLRHLRQR